VTGRAALVVGSALAAGLVAAACVVVMLLVFGEIRYLPGIAAYALALAVIPAMFSAIASSLMVSRAKRFHAYDDLSCASRIVLWAFPSLFAALWVAIWAWLRFNTYLLPLERPVGLLRMAETAFEYTLFAFVVGIVPAIVMEFFVVRSIRRRWSLAVSPGVVP
jgi:hypothetical protein